MSGRGNGFVSACGRGRFLFFLYLGNWRVRDEVLRDDGLRFVGAQSRRRGHRRAKLGRDRYLYDAGIHDGAAFGAVGRA